MYPNFENDIQAQYNSDALNQYLSLIHKTDAALEDLVSYFSKVDEKTVIVFFGDHQPSDAVANQIEMASGVDPSDMNSEQQKKRYQVPYLVWANYDIGEASNGITTEGVAYPVRELTGISAVDTAMADPLYVVIKRFTIGSVATPPRWFAGVGRIVDSF